ncbi:MAG: hypothetical protein QXH24_06860 [Candidatus Bathyarchaeia archaeon]
MILHDIGSNKTFVKVCSCGDAGPPLSDKGFGYMLYKIYVIDEKEKK